MTPRKIAPIDQLKGILIVIDRSKEPPAKVLHTVKEMVDDALAVMLEPEPLKKSCLLALMMVSEATVIEEHHDARGHMHEVVRVKDRDLYTVGMKQVHKLAMAA